MFRGGLSSFRRFWSLDQHVFRVLYLHLLKVFLDDGISAAFSVVSPRFFGALVGVTACSIPVPFDWFGVETDCNIVVFTHPQEKLACHPEVVSHPDAFARTHLELPLPWHHFSVESAHLDSCLQTHSHVSVGDHSSERKLRTNPRLVGSLRAGLASPGPAQWPEIGGATVHEGLFLLDSEPGFAGFGLVHEFGASLAEVGVARHVGIRA